MSVLTPSHDAVLALLDWLPADTDATAALVAELLAISEAEAARLLDDLEAAGCIESAEGRGARRCQAVARLVGCRGAGARSSSPSTGAA
jgi:DNA-binding MarR family transcriptional regulator